MSTIPYQVLIIDSMDVEEIAPLIKYQVDYEKLYADGTGRDLSGNMHADLIGIFTKLELQVKGPDIDSMHTLLTQLKTTFFSVTYFDPETNDLMTEDMYVNDYNTVLKNLSKYEDFSFNLIAMTKRAN